MPTKLPKVQGYLPHQVYDKLNEFKETRKLKSLSVALTEVLEDYFGLSPLAKSDLLTNQSELEKRVQNLEEQIEILTQTVAALATPNPVSKLEGELDIGSPVIQMTTPTPIGELEVSQSDSVGRPLTAKQLADWLGETEGAVNAAAYRGNEAFRKWSENKCGVVWDFIEPDAEAGRKVRLFFRVS